MKTLFSFPFKLKNPFRTQQSQLKWPEAKTPTFTVEKCPAREVYQIYRKLLKLLKLLLRMKY